ncbi:MAG: helical backbone metal receptor [Balneolaceae bacterium]|nr:helical backbone metal receptor [Balneolaceae bacterium]
MSTSFNRIISLVPSLTELLIDLGLKNKLVGRTRFCVHPEDDVDDIPIMGGTKNPVLDNIFQADPDLVIANREENRKADIEQLRRKCEVHCTDIATIEDALITIHELGRLLGVADAARSLTRRISNVLEQRPGETRLRTAYLIWRDPWMTVGSDTYIRDVMDHWGLLNIFDDQERYPTIELRQIRQRYPDLVLLSSEPFPFRQNHVEEVQEQLPNTRVLTVNGEWFSWYGSRMLSSFEQLNTWRKAIA